MAVDYSAIAAKHIRKPGQTKPRILVYGRNKKGKTHLVCTAPNVLVLDPENGTAFENAENVDVWPITRWADLHEAYQALSHGLVSPLTGQPYEWVALDGCTRFANMALRMSMGDEDRDMLSTQRPSTPLYGQANELFKTMVSNFCSLPHGVIFTAYERVEGMPDKESPDAVDEDLIETFRVADMPKGCRGTLNAAVDVIGRMYTTNVQEEYRVKLKSGEIETRERLRTKYRLWLSPHPMYDTGFRTSRDDVPEYLENPTIPALTATLRKG